MSTPASRPPAPAPRTPPRVLGVCSWSLHPASPAELASKVRACGLSAVQLALEPIRAGAWTLDETRRVLKGEGIDILSGMMVTKGEDYSTLETIRRTGGVRPDEHWTANLAAAGQVADIAAELGLTLVTLHAGFIPEGNDAKGRDRMLDRLVEVLDTFNERDVGVAFETGQESAATLVEALEELDDPLVGVNFDPANMIMYNMGDPVEAVRTLADWIVQVHVKDAAYPPAPGVWGTEVRAGAGAVDWPRFFATIDEIGLDIDYLIEREAGDSRVADIQAAAALVKGLSAKP